VEALELLQNLRRGAGKRVGIQAIGRFAHIAVSEVAVNRRRELVRTRRRAAGGQVGGAVGPFSVGGWVKGQTVDQPLDSALDPAFASPGRAAIREGTRWQGHQSVDGGGHADPVAPV
jgi:hypothetical protein